MDMDKNRESDVDCGTKMDNDTDMDIDTRRIAKTMFA
jgi:hypothetical protein